MTRFISYSRASIRLWRKQWLGVFIAVAGLVGALAISLLTAMYLYDGLRSDNWLETSDRLYQVNQQTFQDGKPSLIDNYNMTLLALGPLLPDAVPEMEAHTRFHRIRPKVKDKSTADERIWIAVDAGFANVFPLPMVAGSLEDAVGAPDKLALSWTEAQKYGGLAAIGQTLDAEIEGALRTFEIAAIYQDMPASSHLDLPAITLLHDGTQPKQEWMRHWPNMHTYVTRRVGVAAEQFEATFGQLVDPLIPTNFYGQSREHSVVPVAGLMFHSKAPFGGYMRQPLNRDYLYGLALISAILLASAGFNFVTVFTAINLTRGRELAVRRLAGAERMHLLKAGWVETTLMAALAFVLSLLLAADLAPLAEEFVGVLVDVFDSAKWPVLLGGGLFAGLLALAASSYASVAVLSKRPADLMRDAQGAITGGGTRLRQSLVFLQALVLAATLAAAAQIQNQTHYLLTMDRGMAQTGVMFLNGPNTIGWDQAKLEQYKAQAAKFRGSFHNEAKKLPGVKATAMAGMRPFNSRFFVKRMRNSITNEIAEMTQANVGPDYFDVVGIHVLARLDANWDEISEPVAIEKSMLKALGFESPEAALGYELMAEWPKENSDEITKTPHKIVAVIDDLKDKTGWAADKKPLYGLKASEALNIAVLVLQFDVADENKIRTALGKLWQEQFPEHDLDIKTIEEAVAENHQRQTDSGVAVSIIAGICAVLGFAGLYGMAAHWLQTRQRELALRRVMGASRRAIAFHACRKMLIPVAVGAVLGLLPAWWAGRLWLEQFADQAPVPTSGFGLTALTIVAFAVAILLIHIRTALKKRPARILYHE